MSPSNMLIKSGVSPNVVLIQSGVQIKVSSDATLIQIGVCSKVSQHLLHCDPSCFLNFSSSQMPLWLPSSNLIENSTIIALFSIQYCLEFIVLHNIAAVHYVWNKIHWNEKGKKILIGSSKDKPPQLVKEIRSTIFLFLKIHGFWFCAVSVYVLSHKIASRFAEISMLFSASLTILCTQRLMVPSGFRNEKN